MALHGQVHTGVVGNDRWRGLDCGRGAMVLGRSVVMGVCDRGAKANWRDRGIVDKSSCLMVLRG